MAIQRSLITLRGKLGGNIHYKVDGQPLTRSVPENVDQTEATIRASKEFGVASTAGALIRKAFAPLMDLVADDKLYNRINSKLAGIIRTGPSELQGSRQVTDGDVALLKGIELNRYTELAKLFNVPVEVKVDPLTYATLTLPAFETGEVFSSRPDWTNQAVIRIISSVFDFPEKQAIADQVDDLELPVSAFRFPGGRVEIALDHTDGKVLVIGMALFFKATGRYMSHNRDFYAGRFIEAVYMKDGKVVPFCHPEKVVVPAVPASTGPRIAWQINTTPSAGEPPQ